MSGWVRSYRSEWTHGLFKKEPFTEREAWRWLYSKAAWEDTVHRVGATAYNVPRGAMFTTIRSLMERWKWGNTKTASFLKLLESQDMIELETKTGKTLITVCNYSKYQDTQEQDKTETRQDQDDNKTPPRQDQDTKEELNNKTPKVKSAAKAAPKRGCRLPDDWTAGEQLISFSQAEGLTPTQTQRETSKFRDYWHSRAGAGGVKLDWDLTFKNWIRSAADRNKPSGPQEVSFADVADRMADKLRAAGR